MRKLKLKVQPKLVAVTKKVERRERSREAKALRAADLENSIKNELLARLQAGVHGDQYQDLLEREILNVHSGAFQQSLKAIGGKDDQDGELATLSEEEEAEAEFDGEEFEFEDDEDAGGVEYVEGDFESDDDIEDCSCALHYSHLIQYHSDRIVR